MKHSTRILAFMLCILACSPIACAFMGEAPSATTATQTVTDAPASPTQVTVQTITDVKEEAPAPPHPVQQEEEEVAEPMGKPAPTVNSAVEFPQSKGSITTDMIDAMCQKYHLTPGNYWTIYEPSSGLASFSGRYNCCSDQMMTVTDDLVGCGNPVQDNNYYKSYNYMNQYECHGFACYVMAQVVTHLVGKPMDAVPRTGNHDGWVKYLPDQITDLRVGDIFRVEGGGAQHTAVVYRIDQNGRAWFLESGGGNACAIRLGVGFNHCEDYDTLEKIRDRYCIEYLYRYVGQ